VQQPDQIVVDGYTVTFSKTQTIITDEEGAIRPRIRITRMDNAHGSHAGYNNTPPELPTFSHGTLTITKDAPEQDTSVPTVDLPQSRVTYVAAAYMSDLQPDGAGYFAYTSP
jgi:hypothetical protein